MNVAGTFLGFARQMALASHKQLCYFMPFNSREKDR